MGYHRKLAGKALIDFLEKLGITLDYVVRREYCLQPGVTREAVDVAWFHDERDVYPLMIFEVESAATNGSAENPLKVFVHPNELIEKPLFFFHIFVDSGRDAVVPRNLTAAYNRHNYRVYELKKEGLSRFLEDVLSQHARVSDSVDILQVVQTLLEGLIDQKEIVALVEHCRQSQIGGGSSSFILPYAQLALRMPPFYKPYIELVARVVGDEDDLEPSALEFENGLSRQGLSWLFRPLLIAMLSCAREASCELYPNMLSRDLCLLQPFFGLSQDYDRLVQGWAGGILALFAVLMKSNQDAVDVMMSSQRAIIDAVCEGHCDPGGYNTLWGMHLSLLSSGPEENYEAIRLQAGLVIEDCLLKPLAVLEMEMFESLTWSGSRLIEVPPFQEFERRVSSRIDRHVSADERVMLATEFFIEPRVALGMSDYRLLPGEVTSWPSRLINALHAS